jgi:hypothetical protein
LIVAAILVGGGALVAGLSTWAARRKGVSAEPAPAPVPDRARPPSPLARAGIDVELGDVVDVAGQELWLETAWLLSESGDVIAALFGAREATLVVVPRPRRGVYLLREVALSVPEDPPSTVEAGGVRFERIRRIPVRITAVGASPPLPWDEALYVEYRGLAGDALFLLGRGGRAKAWQGRLVAESDIERWGGGAETLK